MKTLIVFVIGLLIGAVGAAAAIGSQASTVMIQETPSPVGLDETVARITAAAEAEGWVVQGVKKLDESIKKHGGGDVLPVRLVDICNAKHAARIVNDDPSRRVSVFMPCTISVYEKSDGKVYLSSMNAEVLGKLFGGVVAEVMGGDVAEAQGRFIAAVDAPTPPSANTTEASEDEDGDAR